MKRFYTFFVLLLVLSSATAGCTKRPVRPHAAAVAAGSVERLRSDLEKIFSDANFAAAQWGVEIVSLDNGEFIFEKNAPRLYMPASNNKLLAVVAALATLGPEFRYETRLLSGGEIAGGTLNGDLVVVGSGDPTIAARFLDGDVFRVFKVWAVALKQKGIMRVAGNLVGDDGAFEQPPLGTGWAWDDLAYDYAAPVTALQFNENALTLEVKPAEKAGAGALVSVAPLPDYIRISGDIITAEAGTEPVIEIAAGPCEGLLTIAGHVPVHSEPVKRAVAAPNPAAFYLRALRRTLAAEGIAISGEEKVVRGGDWAPYTPVWTQVSPPLSEIIKPLLKVSQNLYAETLVRTLGLALTKQGSFEAGRATVEQVLRRMGIEPGTYSYMDGSGLSRLNLLSADLVVRIFRFVYRQPYFASFYDALPIAGVDGTISRRMKGTRAENNVRAKTGTLVHVRALSGYVRTADGEMLAFSMIANNFLVSSQAAEYVQDCALERLASFSRKEP